MARILIAGLVTVLVVAPSAAQGTGAPEHLTRREMLEDLDAFEVRVQRSIGITRDLRAVSRRINDAINAERRDLPERATRYDFAGAMWRIVASLGDGHARVGGTGASDVGRPPVDVAHTVDGLIVRAFTGAPVPGVSIGDRIVAVDGIEVDVTLRGWSRFVPASTRDGLRHRMARNLLRQSGRFAQSCRGPRRAPVAARLPIAAGDGGHSRFSGSTRLLRAAPAREPRRNRLVAETDRPPAPRNANAIRGPARDPRRWRHRVRRRTLRRDAASASPEHGAGRIGQRGKRRLRAAGVHVAALPATRALEHRPHRRHGRPARGHGTRARHSGGVDASIDSVRPRPLRRRRDARTAPAARRHNRHAIAPDPGVAPGQSQADPTSR